MWTFFKKRKKLTAILVIILIISLYIAQKSLLGDNKKFASAKVTRGKLEEKLTISGKIAASDDVTLQFQTGGMLAWVGVKEGDHVKKYQTIASLDQRQMQKTFQKYLNTYTSGRNTFDQTKDNYLNQVVTDAIKRTIDSSQMSLNNTVLDLEIQNLTIQFANLWSPIEGTVVKVDAPEPGVNIYLPTEAQFEIVDPKSVYFSALADQTEVVNLTPGKRGELVLDSYPDQIFTGAIKTIAFRPKAGETGTVYETKFNFEGDNSDYKYRIGMTGDLTFSIKEKAGALYLPAKFIKEENKKKYVLIGKNGQKQKVYITTGLETDTNTEVTTGLSEGDTVYD